MTIFCHGLVAGNVKHVKMVQMKCLGGMEETLADALAVAPLESLIISMLSNKPSFYNGLLRTLKESKILDSFALGHYEDVVYFDCDELVDVLEQGLSRNLKCLSLHVENWTDRFAKLITRYASAKKNDTMLRKLKLHFGAGFDGPACAPAELVAALDKGERCLEEVLVYHRGKGDISATWCVDLQPTLDLNRIRRIHGPKFESIEHGETWAIRKARFDEAVASVDQNTFYRFLRRNEWSLQKLVKELGHENLPP